MNAPRSGPAKMMTRLPVGFGSTLATLLESSMEPLMIGLGWMIYSLSWDKWKPALCSAGLNLP